MKNRSKISWPRSRGMTLIEVLAALMLMGSILVALVAARSRLVSQHAQAINKQDAVLAADELLVLWWATDPPSVPTQGRGSIESHTGWAWETREVEGAPVELNAKVIRLTIYDERDTTAPQPRILTQVDVLVPGKRIDNIDPVATHGLEPGPFVQGGPLP